MAKTNGKTLNIKKPAPAKVTKLIKVKENGLWVMKKVTVDSENEK